MLSSIGVFLKKNNKKSSKTEFSSMDYHFSSFSLKKQRLCRTTNPLQQFLVMSVVFKKPLGLLMEIIVTELLFRKNLMSRRKTCYVLFSVASSLLPWLVSFAVFPSLTCPKLFCWLLSLVSCSYAHLRAAFKRPLRSPISSSLTLLFLHTVLLQVPLISSWNCSLEIIGLRNATWNTL